MDDAFRIAKILWRCAYASGLSLLVWYVAGLPGQPPPVF